MTDDGISIYCDRNHFHLQNIVAEAEEIAKLANSVIENENVAVGDIRSFLYYSELIRGYVDDILDTFLRSKDRRIKDD